MISIFRVLAIHDQQIAEHGGTEGILDMGLIESALARPMNLEGYSASDVFDLAAEYGYGIARNHGFNETGTPIPVRTEANRSRQWVVCIT